MSDNKLFFRTLNKMPQIPNNFRPAEPPHYVGIDTLQEQTRIKALRQGFTFNLMVAGRSGLGKSTLVNTLFKSSASRRKPGSFDEPIPSTTEIKSSSCDLTEDGVNLRLTVTDTPGFGDQVNNENCWDPLIEHIENQYKIYLEEEQKIERLLNIPDTRIHCLLYFICPSGQELSSLDVEVLRRLNDITNIVPVIAKADTLTMEERTLFKERIRLAIDEHEIQVYPCEDFEDPQDSITNSSIREKIPFAVVGSTNWHESQGRKMLGRKCHWGLIEVENKNHNDFFYLREMLIRTHMRDMIEVTAHRYYERFRKQVLTREMNEKMQLKDANKLKEEKQQEQIPFRKRC